MQCGGITRRKTLRKFCPTEGRAGERAIAFMTVCAAEQMLPYGQNASEQKENRGETERIRRKICAANISEPESSHEATSSPKFDT